MHESLLDLLRCPYCGMRVSLVENTALERRGARIESGVLGCECCAFPIVAGIPVMVADDRTRDSMHALEAGHDEAALCLLLGLDDDRRAQAFRSLVAIGTEATYRDALGVLSLDAEGTYFVYRFSDPTYVSAEALLRSLAQPRWPMAGRTLDLCGGSGHLTRVLTGLRPTRKTVDAEPVLADRSFWKLWLAVHCITIDCAPVCCDANDPLPFSRDAFSIVVLSDAFPYIWHKRLLADELVRVAGHDGVVVLPHLHSALGDNVSAGDTLSPRAYSELFGDQQPRLFSDERMLDDILHHRTVDLTASVSPADLRTEPSLTIVASRRDNLFCRYELSEETAIEGVLMVNPLYRVQRCGTTSVLTLSFPSAEYEAEFHACRRYLPDTVTVDGDLTARLTPAQLGAQYGELRRQRVLLDLPPGYV